MLEKVELVAAVRRWLADRSQELSATGFVSELTESPEDRDPGSVWLVLESDSTIAEVIVWTNGLIDAKSINVETSEVVEMHREVGETFQVIALIDKLPGLPSAGDTSAL
ncbi:immunity protein TriTu family protein [Paractinoplanes tereljensis]